MKSRERVDEHGMKLREGTWLDERVLRQSTKIFSKLTLRQTVSRQWQRSNKEIQ